MRAFLSICALLLFSFSALAQSPADIAKAKAALALGKAKRARVVRHDMIEQAVFAIAKAKYEREMGCLDDINLAWAKVEQQKKPLFLWVGMTCVGAPEVREAFKGVAIHCHADSNNGDKTPRLIVLPYGKSVGVPIPKSELRPDAVKRIRQILTPPKISRMTAPIENCRT